MQRQPSNALNDAIRAIVIEALVSGETTSREVLEAVVVKHDDLIQQHGYNLALRGVSEIIRASMKSAAQANENEGVQLKLPISAEGLPAAITFDIKTTEGLITKYVSLSRATEWHLFEYEKKLSDGIQADSSNLRKVRLLHRTLKPIFDAHPGITVERACQLLGKEDAA